MKHLKWKQIAGMNVQYSQYPLTYFLDSMVQNQVVNIEILGCSPHVYVEDISIQQVREIRNEITRRDLNLVCFTPDALVYPINIADADSVVRERSVQYCLKNIEIAAELGATIMLVTSGWGYYNEPTIDAWNRSCHSLARMAQKAEEYDIVLTLEPLQPFESNLVTNVHTVRNMLDQINSPFLKGNFDTVAIAVAGETVRDYFEILGDRLNHIHLNDGIPSGHLAWGDGVLPLENYLAEIDQYAYTGYLSLELAGSLLPVEAHYFTDPNRSFKQSLDVLKQFLT